MKTLKTVISVPVLRNHLNQFEFRGGVQFEDLLQQCRQIIKYASKGLQIDKPILKLVANSSKRSEGSLIRQI